MRAKPEAVNDVVRFATVCGAQVTILLIYAGFSSIFTNLSPTYQLTFALVIPVFKVAQKNVLSRILSGRDDTKPQVVILNVEIFNSLFISSCMQNSQSIGTSVTLIAVDLLQAAISLTDLCRMINGVKGIMDKLGRGGNELILTAELVLEKYPAKADRRFTAHMQKSNAWTASLAPRLARVSLKKKQVLPTMRMEAGEYVIPIPMSQTLCVRDPSLVSSQHFGSVEKFVEVASARPITALSRLTNREHHSLLKKALQVLFLTEFMLLVEFTEVLVPVIYGGYLTILYYLPNRRFYPQLAHLTDKELQRRVGSVLGYGMLELGSLILLIIVLNRVVHRHSLQQLAFVLEEEFLMVQPKLILWVTMTMQSSLPQLGTYRPLIFNLKMAF
ncbi:uncharacterized protein IUM83_01075 [Phytophthora cinnamomi]|uniref:uncharacterized protein n=1 Tax=Phytophthora cinnamomi TaxID=4785 RepID=UPI00355A65C5|nr:hypothetical protein IUM83_01075 [Phytophthora cinnamomi]